MATMHFGMDEKNVISLARDIFSRKATVPSGRAPCA
jgi:hypothetical protein